MHTSEEIATAGLDVARYPGKWEKAQEMAFQRERCKDRSLLSYWERVRKLFLELGGEYAK